MWGGGYLLYFYTPRHARSGSRLRTRAAHVRLQLHKTQNMLHNRDTGAFRRIAGAPFLHVG